MEQPNLSVIQEISEGDSDFENSILEILKKEFSEEANQYNEYFTQQNFEETSNTVHKLKHKISLLGLKNGLELAAVYEKELKEGKTEFHEKFSEILSKINVYLYE